MEQLHGPDLDQNKKPPAKEALEPTTNPTKTDPSNHSGQVRVSVETE